MPRTKEITDAGIWTRNKMLEELQVKQHLWRARGQSQHLSLTWNNGISFASTNLPVSPVYRFLFHSVEYNLYFKMRNRLNIAQLAVHLECSTILYSLHSCISTNMLFLWMAKSASAFDYTKYLIHEHKLLKWVYNAYVIWKVVLHLHIYQLLQKRRLFF